VNNQDGSVIIAALLVLVLLTIVGIASTNVSNTEAQIAGHTAAYQQNFYRAEGAAIEAADLLEAEPNPKDFPPADGWLEPDETKITDQVIQSWSGWDQGVPFGSANMNDTEYLAVAEGVVSGSSLSMTNSTMYSYRLYGRCAPPNRGATVVQVGYLMAF
jgi:type II secretory pathway pseudopilin PulG